MWNQQTKGRKAPSPESAPVARECSAEQRSAIEQYVARHVAPAEFVFHETQSDVVHIDVHVVPPRDTRPYWFLFTTGMSALKMRVPRGSGLVPRAELSLMLPAWWPVARMQHQPSWSWPIKEMFDLARYPHRYDTWLGAGHTISHAEPPRPYDPSTTLSAMLLLPFSLPGEDTPNLIDTQVATELLALWPLHADELDYKMRRGACSLAHLLDAAGVTAILDHARPSALGA